MRNYAQTLMIAMLVLCATAWSSDTRVFPRSFGLSSLNLFQAEAGVLQPYAFREHGDEFDAKGPVALASAGAGKAKLALGYMDLSRHETYLGKALLVHAGYDWKRLSYGSAGPFWGLGTRFSFGYFVVGIGIDYNLGKHGSNRWLDAGWGF